MLCFIFLDKFDTFKEHTHELNNASSYPQLNARADAADVSPARSVAA